MTHSMKKAVLATAISATGLMMANSASAFTFNEFVKEGDLIAQLRGRSETVEQDNAADDASAQTIRARLGYETADIAGFKVLTEIDHVEALGDDYSVPGFVSVGPDTTGHSVVADPETTDINRAQISYKLDSLSGTLGRQRIILDNARFVGNVGWRQNEQTYDAVRLNYATDSVKATYAYISQVNDIFYRDIETNHHLLNATFSSIPAGKLTAFAYLLEDDDSEATNDTFGLTFKGKTALEDLDLLYTASFATQTANSGADGADDMDASYSLLEGGVKVSGVTLVAGMESLGSDGGDYGFQTPLATKHAFNGWTDQFLGTPAKGLTDIYAKAVTKVYGVKLLAMYHDFSTVEDSDDAGSEINLLAAKKFTKNYSAGIKYANYSAGDDSVGKVDTDKLWVWAEAKF